MHHIQLGWCQRWELVRALVDGWDGLGACGQRMWRGRMLSGVSRAFVQDSGRKYGYNHSILSSTTPLPTSGPLISFQLATHFFVPLSHWIPRRRWWSSLTPFHPISLEPTTNRLSSLLRFLSSPAALPVQVPSTPHWPVSAIRISVSPCFVSSLLFNGKFQIDTQIWKMITWTPTYPDSATINLAVSFYEYLECTNQSPILHYTRVHMQHTHIHTQLFLNKPQTTPSLGLPWWSSG